jgi:hypothetical protein
METIKRGCPAPQLVTVTIGDICIQNVMIPSSDEKRAHYKAIAGRVVGKCGVRTRITYYPIPPSISRQEKLIPFYYLCLARERQGRMEGQIF